MVRSLEQISRDLESLATATKSIDDTLKELYEKYLDVLGQAVKHQLVLAAYHLCTQVYPEAFLQLSVSQREKVQGGIRQIARQGCTQMKQLGQVVAQELTVHSSDENDSMIASEEMQKQNTLLQDSEQEVSSDQESNSAAEVTSQEASEMAQRLSSSLSLLAAFQTEPLSPISLAKRHVLLERQLRAILQMVSNLANYLLKQAHVLPDLPEMVIAAAAEAEAGEPSTSTPNLLNVLVEIGNDRTIDNSDEEQDSENKEGLDEEELERNMTHLIAINLRLADIEFSDTHTALWRSKLQKTLARLKRLGSQYQKLQREKARAEAEYAWRATWFEE
ncbi:MAG: hypothetical protein F6K42_27580 [Leptolyngbya sp. SIO1D8]|nr:hypothetical protein [Leptolyngbya sp. SIO1D8]